VRKLLYGDIVNVINVRSPENEEARKQYGLRSSLLHKV
jgi:hypothetical protein